MVFCIAKSTRGHGTDHRPIACFGWQWGDGISGPMSVRCSPPSAGCRQRRIATLGNVMSMELESIHHPYSEGHTTRVYPKYVLRTEYRPGKIFHSLCAVKWLYTHDTPKNPYRPNTPAPSTPKVPKQIPFLQSQMRIGSG